MILIVVIAISVFIYNISVVVILIPIMHSLASRSAVPNHFPRYISSDVLPTAVAALPGAAAMVALGFLSGRDSTCAVDPFIRAAIGNESALGTDRQEIRETQYMVHGMAVATKVASPGMLFLIYLLVVVGLLNIVSVKMTVVLFMPSRSQRKTRDFYSGCYFRRNFLFASALGNQKKSSL